MKNRVMEIDSYTNISNNGNFSREKINTLRNDIKDQSEFSDCLLFVSGSFGRHEGFTESDFDYFLIVPDIENNHQSKIEKIDTLIKNMGLNLPSKQGAFANYCSFDELDKNIGGKNDTNETLTRRVLFILESKFVYNEQKFVELRNNVLTKYIKDSITDHQLALFFLNDIIRYYRTMCVDFEYKTVELNQDWGLRNIKLVFSRKLLYFSGILIAAETAQSSSKRKKARFSELIALTPVERILHVCGDRSTEIIETYDYFLGQLNDKDVRNELKSVRSEARHDSELFRDLKDRAHWFSWALIKLLENQYEKSHPIFRALMF